MEIGRNRGPRLIVGHVTEKSAKVWGRGDSERPVMFLEAESESGQKQSLTVPLSPEDGYTGVAVLDDLNPSTEYDLRVSYGSSTQTAPESRDLEATGRLETFPNPQDDEPFSFLLNSCNFHGFGWFRNNDQAVARRAEVAEGVDMILHAGDQIYADMAPMSFTLENYRDDYLRVWNDEGTAKVLASQANYMIPDDHEVVNGYAEDGELTLMQRVNLALRGHHKSEREQYEELAANGIKAFREFQRSHGPHTHGKDVNYYNFSHGQHQFFAMDTSFTRNHGEGRLISKAQQAALFDWLTEHREQPKFIMTSTPFVLESKESEGKWHSTEFQAQREEIIDFLAREKLDNVVFLAGDIHASGHARMTIGEGEEAIVIDELIASPVNATRTRGREKFVGSTQGVTTLGTTYQTQLDEESFLGRESWMANKSSAVMKVNVDGDQIEYEIHRTRETDPAPARQGRFQL